MVRQQGIEESQEPFAISSLALRDCRPEGQVEKCVSVCGSGFGQD